MCCRQGSWSAHDSEVWRSGVLLGWCCRHLDLDHSNQETISKLAALPVARGSRDHTSTPNRGTMLPEARWRRHLSRFLRPALPAAAHTARATAPVRTNSYRGMAYRSRPHQIQSTDPSGPQRFLRAVQQEARERNRQGALHVERHSMSGEQGRGGGTITGRAGIDAGLLLRSEALLRVCGNQRGDCGRRIDFCRLLTPAASPFSILTLAVSECFTRMSCCLRQDLQVLLSPGPPRSLPVWGPLPACLSGCCVGIQRFSSSRAPPLAASLASRSGEIRICSQCIELKGRRRGKVEKWVRCVKSQQSIGQF